MIHLLITFLHDTILIYEVIITTLTPTKLQKLIRNPEHPLGTILKTLEATGSLGMLTTTILHSHQTLTRGTILLYDIIRHRPDTEVKDMLLMECIKPYLAPPFTS